MSGSILLVLDKYVNYLFRTGNAALNLTKKKRKKARSAILDKYALREVIEEAGDNTVVKVNALIKRGALHIQRCIGGYRLSNSPCPNCIVRISDIR